MDDMHPPRVAISRVYALGGTPPYEDVLQYPLGYTPKGRVPVCDMKPQDRMRKPGWLVYQTIGVSLTGESPRPAPKPTSR